MKHKGKLHWQSFANRDKRIVRIISLSRCGGGERFDRLQYQRICAFKELEGLWVRRKAINIKPFPECSYFHCKCQHTLYGSSAAKAHHQIKHVYLKWFTICQFVLRVQTNEEASWKGKSSKLLRKLTCKGVSFRWTSSSLPSVVSLLNVISLNRRQKQSWAKVSSDRRAWRDESL